MGQKDLSPMKDPVSRGKTGQGHQTEEIPSGGEEGKGQSFRAYLSMK